MYFADTCRQLQCTVYTVYRIHRNTTSSGNLHNTVAERHEFSLRVRQPQKQVSVGERGNTMARARFCYCVRATPWALRCVVSNLLLYLDDPLNGDSGYNKPRCTWSTQHEQVIMHACCQLACGSMPRLDIPACVSCHTHSHTHSHTHTLYVQPTELRDFVRVRHP